MPLKLADSDLSIISNQAHAKKMLSENLYGVHVTECDILFRYQACLYK